MSSADERNGAVAAFPVAALGDFQVGVMLRRGQVPLGLQRRVFGRAQRPDDAVPRAGAEEFVHFGQFGTQLVGIAFRETADDEQPFDLSGVFGRGRPQDHVDRLLLGVADETAGVDHDDLGVGAVAVEEHLVTRRGEPGHQVLAVHGVFRTAQRYDVDFFHAFRVSSAKVWIIPGFIAKTAAHFRCAAAAGSRWGTTTSHGCRRLRCRCRARSKRRRHSPRSASRPA